MDNYYEREDMVANTAEVALDNLEAAANALTLNAESIQQWNTETGAFLGAMYERAQAAGDEQAMMGISITWENTQKVSDEFIKLFSVQQSLQKMARRLIARNQAMQDALDEIEEAVVEQDETHPMLEDFAHQVRREERLNIYSQALEKATIAVMQEFHDGLRRIAGNSDYAALHRFMDLLTRTDIEPTPLQRALVTDLLNTCAEQVEGEAADVQ